jgi:hypothetical protein
MGTFWSPIYLIYWKYVVNEKSNSNNLLSFHTVKNTRLRLKFYVLSYYINSVHHHHHHQPINVPTAGAQALLMDSHKENGP